MFGVQVSDRGISRFHDPVPDGKASDLLVISATPLRHQLGRLVGLLAAIDVKTCSSKPARFEMEC